MADNNNVRKRVAANGKVNSFEYEVFGKVQKVGFRVMMNKKMKEFKNNDVSGSAINTKEGTVKGIMFGNEENLEEMKMDSQGNECKCKACGKCKECGM